jgi:hypothetical protein
MAHFAEIDNKNRVLRVLVVPDEQEHRGSQYLSLDLGLGGDWIQTSYNHHIRKQFAGIGYVYDEINDVFIAPRPYQSWTLNEDFDWVPPVPRPADIIDEENHTSTSWIWNEDIQNWEEITDYWGM